MNSAGGIPWISVLQCRVNTVYYVVILGVVAINLQDIWEVLPVEALLNMPLGDRLGLGNVSFFLESCLSTKTQINNYSSASLPDYGVSFPVSCTSLSDFHFILCHR